MRLHNSCLQSYGFKKSSYDPRFCIGLAESPNFRGQKLSHAILHFLYAVCKSDCVSEYSLGLSLPTSCFCFALSTFSTAIYQLCEQRKCQGITEIKWCGSPVNFFFSQKTFARKFFQPRNEICHFSVRKNTRNFGVFSCWKPAKRKMSRLTTFMECTFVFGFLFEMRILPFPNF